MSGNLKSPFGWAWLKQGSGNATFVVGTLLLLFLIGGGVYWSQNRPEARVSLLAGAKLLEHDLGRMQLAFGGAGLNDFEVRDGQVFVPQNQRDLFLKALNDHDGIPETSRELYEPDSLNPWATSRQVQESTLLRKKRMIRQLVLQLEFVADAVIDYDELVDAGWPPTTRRSAAIVVRPRSDRLLETYQVDAIRNTICGAVAGLTPTDIVITDIAAGHAYVGATSSPEATGPASLLWLERAKIEQRICDQMTSFGSGIEVHVTEDNGSIDSETVLLPPTPKVATTKINAPIANQPAAIEAACEPRATDAEPMGTEAASAELPSFVVKIRIPEQLVRDFVQSQPVDSIGEQTLDQGFQALQSQIKSAVQPFLLTGSTRKTRSHIDVSMTRRPRLLVGADNPIVNAAWQEWSPYVPAMGLILGIATFFILSLLWKRAFRRRHHEDEHSPIGARSSRASLPIRPTADSISDDTKRKLQQMVDDDPDQAAEIIKQWISGAA